MRKILAESLQEYNIIQQLKESDYWENGSITYPYSKFSYIYKEKTENRPPESSNVKSDRPFNQSSSVYMNVHQFAEMLQELLKFAIEHSTQEAFEIFKSILKDNPYLTRKPIGFNRKNPYKEYIDDFLFKLNLIYNEYEREKE